GLLPPRLAHGLARTASLRAQPRACAPRAVNLPTRILGTGRLGSGPPRRMLVAYESCWLRTNRVGCVRIVLIAYESAAPRVRPPTLRRTDALRRRKSALRRRKR